jgi:cbb3-type cytochrome oxidase subunit 3
MTNFMHPGLIGLLFFFVFFVVMLVWLYRPGAKKTFQDHGLIPLKEENDD